MVGNTTQKRQAPEEAPEAVQFRFQGFAETPRNLTRNGVKPSPRITEWSWEPRPRTKMPCPGSSPTGRKLAKPQRIWKQNRFQKQPFRAWVQQMSTHTFSAFVLHNGQHTGLKSPTAIESKPNLLRSPNALKSPWTVNEKNVEMVEERKREVTCSVPRLSDDSRLATVSCGGLTRPGPAKAQSC